MRLSKLDGQKLRVAYQRRDEAVRVWEEAKRSPVRGRTAEPYAEVVAAERLIREISARGIR